MIRGKHWDDGWLTAYWGTESRARKGESKDVVFGSPCRSDGHLLYGALAYIDMGHGKNLVQELEDRGYDITTLQFSIKRKYPPNGNPAGGTR